jgi:hypothetical protein
MLEEALAIEHWWTNDGAEALRRLLFPFHLKVCEARLESFAVVAPKALMLFNHVGNDEWMRRIFFARGEHLFNAHESIVECIERRAIESYSSRIRITNGVQSLMAMVEDILNNQRTPEWVWKNNPLLI